jgi:hypothetical protein
MDTKQEPRERQTLTASAAPALARRAMPWTLTADERRARLRETIRMESKKRLNRP